MLSAMSSAAYSSSSTIAIVIMACSRTTHSSTVTARGAIANKVITARRLQSADAEDDTVNELLTSSRRHNIRAGRAV